jgi:hypothetical protein
MFQIEAQQVLFTQQWLVSSKLKKLPPWHAQFQEKPQGTMNMFLWT